MLEIKTQQSAAGGAGITARQRSVADDRINREAPATRAGHGRLARIRRRCFTSNRHLLTRLDRDRLEGGVARITNVIEAARGIAGISHLARAAGWAGKTERAEIHHTNLNKQRRRPRHSLLGRSRRCGNIALLLKALLSPERDTVGEHTCLPGMSDVRSCPGDLAYGREAIDLSGLCSWLVAVVAASAFEYAARPCQSESAREKSSVLVVIVAISVKYEIWNDKPLALAMG